MSSPSDFPPPPPAARTPFWRPVWSWYRSRKLWLQLVIIALILVIVLGAIGAASGGNQNSPSTSSTPTTLAQATATRAPTVPPATATPHGPQLLSTATIGGTEAAFQTAYGPPSGTGSAKTYNFTQPGIIGMVTATPSSDSSADGQQHIVSLRIGPASGVWDATTATPICAAFVPADAKFQKTMNVAGYGPERVYQSAALAQVFPASAFTDSATGNVVTPGTFAMELGAAFPGNIGCIIILGT